MSDRERDLLSQLAEAEHDLAAARSYAAHLEHELEQAERRALAAHRQGRMAERAEAQRQRAQQAARRYAPRVVDGLTYQPEPLPDYLDQEAA